MNVVLRKRFTKSSGCGIAAAGSLRRTHKGGDFYAEVHGLAAKHHHAANGEGGE
ncbi:hypothetical protein [Lacticaseibacillus hegangensis]|uniref:hypothetical protein n=1 Tax=Lacticaseibacillus hegangensis TaxID=2486010 RepID=UPI0013DDF214|nr:hypothetical protein [Lacticaseibacillus hegangensis]